MECQVCGGTDFYNEFGFFYCNECQTQSQEVREHEFQEEVTHVRGIKKIKKEKVNNHDKITSWECYNIVMCSLTNQLINLGANKDLKQIVKCLWMKYLQKLEVFQLNEDVKPRLQLINSKRDADILYGVQPKKRKRKKSTESFQGSDVSAIKRERSRKKRALVKAEYEEFSQKSAQESSSLHNETLTSLKSASEKSDKYEDSLCFNKYSVRELKKNISVRHYRQRKLDIERNLQCHKLTYRSCSLEYSKGIYFLSPIKMYCILYLGLLINRDQIQLSDLFRFMREGHLSFNDFKGLFPEEYMDKFLNIRNNSQNNLFSNDFFRTTAAKIAKFLDVSCYIKVVDLSDLCQRFCKEMNLPGDLYEAVRNIISKVKPKLYFSRSSKIIPNYEGRAMSIILFTLKLLFGLDGVTEWKLSKYAQLVNQENLDKPKMFDIVEWMEYIGYRRLVISQHHFPTMYLNSPDNIDSDLFLQHIESQEMKSDDNAKLNKELRGYKEILTKIKECQENNNTSIKYSPSLTPFLEYSQVLNSSEYDLSKSFIDNSLDFLLRPNKYLQLISDDVQTCHGGANNNWVIENLMSYRKLKYISAKDLGLIPIEVSKYGKEKYIDEAIGRRTIEPKEIDPQHVQVSYNLCRQNAFHDNEIYLKRISKQVELSKKLKRNGKSEYNTHYNPYERYWLYLQMNIDRLSKNDFDTYFNKHSSAFKIILNECARIIELNAQEFLHEFQFTELYLVFGSSFCGKNERQLQKSKLLDPHLKHYVNKAKAFW